MKPGKPSINYESEDKKVLQCAVVLFVVFVDKIKCSQTSPLSKL